MRILLVDDHPVVRQGIRTILTDRLKGAVVGEAADAATALVQVRSGDWDVVVADKLAAKVRRVLVALGQKRPLPRRALQQPQLS